MKRLLLAALATFALATSVDAQVRDYNSRIALKGVKKIFVDAGKNRKEREQILKVLRENEQKIPGVEVVNSALDAEVILYYRIYLGGYFGPGADYHDTVSVTGSVVVREKFSGERVLLTYDMDKGPVVDRPAVQFAKAFVKAWAKANK